MKKKRNIGRMEFIRQLVCRFRDDEVPALGAQLTYYLILAFFPFLIFLVSVVGVMQMFGEEVIRDLILLLPEQSSGLIRTVLDEVTASRSHSLLSLGMVATIWSASNGINAVIKGLNKAYDEAETRPFWKVRGLSVLSTIILAVVFLLSASMVVFGKVIGEQLFERLGYPAGFDTIWSIVKYVIPLAAMLGVFMLLYRFAPNRKLRYQDVWPGALAAALGWIVTSLLFSFYVNAFGSYSKTYGSLGGAIVLLIWLYISSIILLVGGEMNATFAFFREGKAKDECKRYGWNLPMFSKRNASPEAANRERTGAGRTQTADDGV
ncbi:YihY/virulence factor BrkB family protein [Paenibacillus oceani]|uniref:YihY/virulence factor BrkB family protein n=1 Tax=Paenibacillus oceani TaxID=2772510 RepID=A0A927GXW4_9BACL|nr:YihY/virulence factor BrkB family protein [Paenibacillus oceani]MBD2860960.1 YihY/virulence factor BrkB family protein [Paenibacillus oceani]